MAGIFDQAVEVVKKGKRFLIVSHVNPEGDAIGSLIALALVLKQMGKDVVAYLEDPVPDLFAFLPGIDIVTHKLGGEVPFDATFALDCGQVERFGTAFRDLSSPGTCVNIDHHVSNDNFGDINVVVPDASAAGELVYGLIKALGAPVTPDIATNLYVAIQTDTGSFHYSSTSPEAFEAAGQLVRLGADPWSVTVNLYESNPVEKFFLLSKVLSTLEIVSLEAGGRNGTKVATLVLTPDMIDSTGADRSLSDGFVNYARSVKGVVVGMLFREGPIGQCKVSFRAKGDLDVAALAARFGGGGHKNAAGCNVKGSIAEVKEKIFDAMRESLFRPGSS